MKFLRKSSVSFLNNFPPVGLSKLPKYAKSVAETPEIFFAASSCSIRASLGMTFAVCISLRLIEIFRFTARSLI